MKLNILTIHHIHNFGSVFQAYGLQRFLQEEGYDTKVIDYRPAYYNAGRNKLKTLAGKALNLGPYLTRKRKFEKFIASHMNLSKKKACTQGDLKDQFEDCDEVFIAGGDQLWNNYHPCGNDDVYKLAFARRGRKLAYGTSMGRDNFTEEELEDLAAKTGDFQCIMLREKSTVGMLQAHTAVPVCHVIDPVGLLAPEAFDALALKPAIKEPYAVMYLADSGPLLDKAISMLSQKMGLKIVHICGFRKKCYCDSFEKDVGPEEILGYIRHADFVLSASFHATMFSLLFGKQFATLLPDTHTNARIQDLLNFVGLSERIIRDEQSVTCLDYKIDYAPVNEKLCRFREYSRKCLLRALADLEKK